MIPHIATEVIAVIVGLFTVVGLLMAAQWRYYWPKVQEVVQESIGEAMKEEREFVKREIDRVDKSHDTCRLEVDKKLTATEEGVKDDIKYIRGRIDWLIDRVVNGE